MEVKPGYKQTEVGVIPEDWDQIPIGRAGEVLGGRQRSPNRIGELCKYLRVANVFEGFIDTDDVLEMPFSSSEKQRFQLKVGDILLNEGQSIELVGRSAIYRGNPPDCCFQNTLVRFRANTGTCTEFTQFIFQHFLKTGTFASIALQTTSIAHLGAGRLASLRMPLPTLAEQEAIAEALSDADALIESLEQLIAKKRHIKQGAMQELLTGKRRLPGFEVKPGYKQTEVGVIPEDWEVKFLGDVGESLIGLTYSPSDVRDDGILVLRSSNIQESQLQFDDNVFVEMDVSERIMVRSGDILICVRNGSRDLIGKCVQIDNRALGMTFGAFMAVYRSPLNNFIIYMFQSGTIKRQIHEHLGATINQITNSSLNSFVIPLPPALEEQTAIADILSDMNVEIEYLEAKLSKARRIKQGMMQELLTGRIRLV